MKLKKLAIAGLILLVPSLTAAIRFTQKTEVGDRVVKVIDGDTFKLHNKQNIRLASVDAPALDKCLGQEAKTALSKLILNKRVVLLEPFVDKYDRIIAVVLSNGQIINEIMVRNGYALNTGVNLSAKKALQDANVYARNNSLGIFAPECSQVDPPDPDCVIKGNHAGRHWNKPMYTYPGCPNYSQTIVDTWKDDQWFCTESEAKKAGYIKSGNCTTNFQKP